MFEFDIFKIMYPVVEERDAEMERLTKCHLKLIEDYKDLYKEYDRLKGLREKYEKLEKDHDKVKVDCEKYHERFRSEFKRCDELVHENDNLEMELHKLREERDILKSENIRLKRRDFVTENKNLRSKYDELEQKYWDNQRLISEYAQENEELKKCYMDTSNSMNLYKYKKDISEKDNEQLLKELNAVKTELAETKKYLEGYQRLYVEEALKNTDPNYMDISEKYLRVIEKYKKAED